MNPYNTIPKSLPDIAMLSLSTEEVGDLRDVPLSTAIMDSRRRLMIKFDKLRTDTNAHFDERLAVTRTPNVAAPSPAATTDATTPDAPCNSATWQREEDDEEERKVRRRLDNDITKLDVTKLVGNQFDGPQYFGKTPVKDISTILPSTNLSTHPSFIVYLGLIRVYISRNYTLREFISYIT